MGDSPPFTVGGVATITCVSDSPASMIQWLDNTGSQVAMTISEQTLDYSFNPVRDDIQGSRFTCRVTRVNEMVDQLITLFVTGEFLRA